MEEVNSQEVRLGINHAQIIEEVLKPTVRIRTDKAIGSGSIIKSDEEGTYILTNRHVVDDAIEYKDVWDELLRREVKKEFTKLVEVDIPKINKIGNQVALTTAQAEIVLSNSEQDMALLHLKDEDVYPSVKWYPKDLADKIPILTPLASCGAAMGEKPIVTFGNLNGIGIEIDNYEYDLSSASSVFGFSGGTVFANLNGSWHFVGIPSRVRVAIIGFSVDVVPFLSYFIPIRRVYKWLTDNCYEFLWGEKSKEECDKAREEKRQKELAIAIAREKA